MDRMTEVMDRVVDSLQAGSMRQAENKSKALRQLKAVDWLSAIEKARLIGRFSMDQEACEWFVSLHAEHVPREIIQQVVRDWLGIAGGSTDA